MADLKLVKHNDKTTNAMRLWLLNERSYYETFRLQAGVMFRLRWNREDTKSRIAERIRNHFAEMGDELEGAVKDIYMSAVYMADYEELAELFVEDYDWYGHEEVSDD